MSQVSSDGFTSLDPLLVWARVGLILALLLIGEAIVLWLNTRGHRVSASNWIRACAVAAFVGAIGLLVFAQRAWSTFYMYPPVNWRSPPYQAVVAREQSLRQALETFQVLGWVGVGITSLLLILGVLLVRWRPGNTATARQVEQLS